MVHGPRFYLNHLSHRAMSDTYNNPRRDVISCSALYRLDNCPASWLLSKRAEELGIVPPAGPEADSGTRIHRALETGHESDWDALSPEEGDLAERCQEQAQRVYFEWRERYGISFKGQHLEARVGMTSERSFFVKPITEGMPYIATGQADVLTIGGGSDRLPEYALIMDYKTGRGEVDSADSNAQLRGLAAIVSRLPFGPSQIRVAIIQPWGGQPTVADYDEAALEHARLWLRHVHDKAMLSTGEVRLGDHCQYCPARALCPALREAATYEPDVLEIERLPEDSKTAKSALIARALDLTPEMLTRALKGRRLINWYLGAIEAAARIRLEKGEPVPGYELKEVNGHRAILDSSKAAQAVAHLLENAEGGPAAAIIRSCAISPPDLQDEIRKASGVKRKKDGSEGRGYVLTEDAAKKELAAALGELMTQSKSRRLVEVEVGEQLEDDE